MIAEVSENPVKATGVETRVIEEEEDQKTGQGLIIHELLPFDLARH